MIEISKEDFAEYVTLCNSREVIVEKLRRCKSIQVPDLLILLGGDSAWELYREITKEDGNV